MAVRAMSPISHHLAFPSQLLLTSTSLQHFPSLPGQSRGFDGKT
jgi:hypothetical protein